MDAETGERILVDTHDPNVRKAFRVLGSRERDDRTRMFRQMKDDAVNIFTEKSYVDPLVRFFRLRERRMAM